MGGRWPHEGPTWVLAGGIYLGWGLLTWHFMALPLWFSLPAGAWLLAWHGSLQHEAVHGHPTRISWLNTTIAGLPLCLWMPYPAYRETHLLHHQTQALTDPDLDPESYYLTPEQWERCGGMVRGLLIANNSLLGRLFLGPVMVVGRYWYGELRALWRADFRHGPMLAAHVALVSPVMAWVTMAAGVPAVFYLLIVYGGVSLTLMRSFLEHRPAAQQAERTAIVEAGPIWSLLFLNNNLHDLHHRQPGMPWYELGRAYRAERQDLRGSNGGYVFAGYGEVARRFLLRPKDHPLLSGNRLYADTAVSLRRRVIALH